MLASTLVKYLDTFERRGSEIAYVHRRGYRIQRWSYRDVARTSFQLARELEARHIAKGEPVLVWGENCAEWVIAFLGCVLRGAVVIPMDRIASTDFARRVMQQAKVKLAFCSQQQTALVPDVPVIALEVLADAVRDRSADPYRGTELTRESIVEIVFTSGTTAEPKGVVITHRNVLANLEPLEKEITRYLKYERVFHPLRFLNLLPLSHVFGQFLGIFVPQLLGATVIFHETLNPSEIVRTIKRERVSVLVAVPRLLETLRDKIRRTWGLPAGGTGSRSSLRTRQAIIS
jgi:long-chain acyl-CoA synthetase